jgi:cell division septation protein DedD
MASREKKGGGDFVLESRHLVGLFLLLVVIFGVVFTLGYLLGRSQFDTRLRAAVDKPIEAAAPPASPSAKSKVKTDAPNSLAAEETQPSRVTSDWDFYHSADPKAKEDHLQPAKKSVAAAPPSAPKPTLTEAKATMESKSPAPVGSSLVAKGSVMLQVAAVINEGDALALAQALQQKKFPAFVITPATDKFYRVQVGPYADAQSASAARRDLEAKGFKSIVKR